MIFSKTISALPLEGGPKALRKTAAWVGAVVLAASSLITGTQRPAMASENVLYVVNQVHSAVSMIDTLDGTAHLTRITTRTHPTAIAVTPDGITAYVACGCTHWGTVVSSKPAVENQDQYFYVDQEPRAMALSPDYLYVVNYGGGSVTPISIVDNSTRPSIPVGLNPTAIALTLSAGYVTNERSGTVSKIDLATRTNVATITVGDSPSAIAVANATAFVANAGSDNVVPIDLSDNSIGPAISVGNRPVAIATSADGSRAYVANSLDDTVTPINLTTVPPTPLSPIAVGDEPRALLIDEQAQQVYVANYRSDDISVISIGSGAVTDTWQTGVGPTALALVPRVTANLSDYPTGTNPVRLPTFGDGQVHAAPANSAYVANVCDNTVSVVDLDRVASTITVSAGSQPAGIALTPNGQKAFVANFGDGTVMSIPTSTNIPGPPIPVGLGANFVAITPDGSTVLVSNMRSNSVSFIDAASDLLLGSIAVGLGPTAIAITPNGQKAYVALYWDSKTAVIDIPTRTKIGEILMNLSDPERKPSHTGGFAVDPQGLQAYAVNANTSDVVPIVLATDSPRPSIGMDALPTFVAITPDGTRAYVTSTGQSSVIPINLTSQSALPPIVGPFDHPQPVTVSPDGATVYVGNYGTESMSSRNTMIPIRTIDHSTLSALTTGFGPEAIAIMPDQAPTAVFQAIRQTGSMTVDFDASASTSPRGSITKYAWDFDDGNVAEGNLPTVQHVYLSEDIYTVKLTVTNSAGTSTTRVFTGQTMSRNGGPSAHIEKQVAVGNFSAPSAPRNLSSSFGQREVTLSWEAPSNNGNTSVLYYNIYRGTNPSNQTLYANAGNALGFVDSGVFGGASYVYSVTAVNAAGESAHSSDTSISVPVMSPGAPTGLTATRINNVVNLSWLTPADHGSPITQYNIYRRLDGGSETLIDTIGPDTTYSDSTTRYLSASYRVTAVNSAGESAPSNVASSPLLLTPTITKPIDGISTKPSTTMEGTGAPNAFVDVREGEVLIGRARADAAGFWSIQASDLAPGAHSIFAESIDPYGNTSLPSPLRNFIVDAESPGITITTPPNSVFLSFVEDPIVSGTATDNLRVAGLVADVYSAGSLVTTQSISAGQTTAAQTVWRINATCSCPSPSVTWSLDLSSLPPGSYWVRVFAFDEAGNYSWNEITVFLL